tara:strand:- start:5 stop:274 length:270 start_codon:yes stop_codon:yes gene_type:complete
MKMRKIKLNKSLSFEDMKDSLIILNLDEGIFYETNEVAKGIINLLLKEASIEEIYETLEDQYEIKEDFRSEVDTFIDEMIKSKIILEDE